MSDVFSYGFAACVASFFFIAHTLAALGFVQIVSAWSADFLLSMAWGSAATAWVSLWGKARHERSMGRQGT
jgi:hypothetical protein